MNIRLCTSCSLVVFAATILIPATGHASNFILDSNSSTVAYVGSSGTTETPASFGTSTYDYGTGGGAWATPVGTSNWVSFIPNGNSYISPSGTYYYSDSFAGSAADFGVIWILADDTASIYLNGNVIEVPDPYRSATSRCTAGPPNCETAAEFVLPLGDFVDGTNVLTFGVQQLYGSGTGLDFEATVDPPDAPTPEPNSLMLLGTGVLGVAGLLRRRIRAGV